MIEPADRDREMALYHQDHDELVDCKVCEIAQAYWDKYLSSVPGSREAFLGLTGLYERGRREAIEELHVLWRWADSQGMVGDQMNRVESFLSRALAGPAEPK
jgi:hypothetical protein